MHILHSPIPIIFDVWFMKINMVSVVNIFLLWFLLWFSSCSSTNSFWSLCMSTFNLEQSSSSNGKSTIEDPLRSFFIHHADNTGLILVFQPLSGENYASWSRALKISLSAKSKLGFVDGSITRPSDDDLVLLQSWIRNNNIVISWILNSVCKEISRIFIFSESATDMWNDLNDRFKQSNGPRILQLHNDLVN